LRIFYEGGDGRVYGCGIQERFIALDIHENVAGFMGGDFGHPFRSSAVIRASHTRFAAERLDGLHDAVIVGGHDDAVDALRHFGTLVDALDHGFPSQ
jgi:hypothetical protein